MERVDFRYPTAASQRAASTAMRHKLDAPAIRALEEMMCNCLGSVLIERARQAESSGGRVYRELPFVRPLQDPTGTAIEEGKIDLLFEEAGEWVLVDYKTDQVSDNVGEAEAFFRERYAGQMKQYAAALEALGLKTKAAYLLLARTGESIQMLP